MDEINLVEVLRLINKSKSSNFKLNNKSNIDINNKPTSINKVKKLNFKNMKQFCKAYIKSIYIRIVKSKKRTLIIKIL